MRKTQSGKCRYRVFFCSATQTRPITTLFQESAGTKADRGEIDFLPGPGRQFLVFPKSLKRFGGRVVVPIKYELLAGREAKLCSD
jgi:hypothetical protein